VGLSSAALRAGGSIASFIDAYDGVDWSSLTSEKFNRGKGPYFQLFDGDAGPGQTMYVREAVR
jgi:hypothetical protein